MSAREVTLLGGSPWGFRMHGGHDLHQPLRISRVNPGSKAAQQGVREGDLISSINGKSTRELTNSEAHALLRNASDHLKLGLNQENIGSPKRRIYKSSIQENTSTETLKKITTTTTTTSNTRVISSENKRKNGADDAKTDRNYANQNGGLKSSLLPDQRTDKKGDCEFLDRYVTDFEEEEEEGEKSRKNIRMPQGSRSRKNRRNRNRRRNPRPPTPDAPSRETESTSSLPRLVEETVANRADVDDTTIVETNDCSLDSVQVPTTTATTTTNKDDLDDDVCDDDRNESNNEQVANSNRNYVNRSSDDDNDPVIFDKNDNNDRTDFDSGQVTDRNLNCDERRTDDDDQIESNNERVTDSDLNDYEQINSNNERITDSNRNDDKSQTNDDNDYEQIKSNDEQVADSNRNDKSQTNDDDDYEQIKSNNERVTDSNRNDKSQTDGDDDYEQIKSNNEQITDSNRNDDKSQTDDDDGYEQIKSNNERVTDSNRNDDDSQTDDDDGYEQVIDKNQIIDDDNDQVILNQNDDNDPTDSDSEQITDSNQNRINDRSNDRTNVEENDTYTDSKEGPEQAEASRRRLRIEKGAVENRRQSIEISMISSLPLAGKIDYIASVGILETGSLDEKLEQLSPNVTISEPAESLEPLSDRLKAKVEQLEEASGELDDYPKTWTKRTSFDLLEIREVDATEVAPEEAKSMVVVEMESDGERDKIERTPRLAGPEHGGGEGVVIGGPGKATRRSCDATMDNGDGGMSKEMERKLRNFIEGLKLPTCVENAKEEYRLEQQERMEWAARKKARKRAILESYYQSQEANRFLDIIQEEREKLSEDDEQQIRDFINEEIGKYRRDDRSRERKVSREGESRQRILVKHDIEINVVDYDESRASKKGVEVSMESTFPEEIDPSNCSGNSLKTSATEGRGKGNSASLEIDETPTLEEEERANSNDDGSNEPKLSSRARVHCESELDEPATRMERVSNGVPPSTSESNDGTPRLENRIAGNWSNEGSIDSDFDGGHQNQSIGTRSSESFVKDCSELDGRSKESTRLDGEAKTLPGEEGSRSSPSVKDAIDTPRTDHERASPSPPPRPPRPKRLIDRRRTERPESEDPEFASVNSKSVASPPVPPLRRKKETKEVRSPPERPPLPKELCPVASSTCREPVYENVVTRTTTGKNVVPDLTKYFPNVSSQTSDNKTKKLERVARNEGKTEKDDEDKRKGNNEKRIRQVRIVPVNVEQSPARGTVDKIVDERTHCNLRASTGGGVRVLRNELDGDIGFGSETAPEITDDRDGDDRTAKRTPGLGTTFASSTCRDVRDASSCVSATMENPRKRKNDEDGKKTHTKDDFFEEARGWRDLGDVTSSVHEERIVEERTETRQESTLMISASKKRSGKEAPESDESSRFEWSSEKTREEFGKKYDSDDARCTSRKTPDLRTESPRKDRERIVPVVFGDDTISDDKEGSSRQQPNETREGQDSSSSTASFSTVKCCNPMESSVADVRSILQEEEEEEEEKEEERQKNEKEKRQEKTKRSISENGDSFDLKEKLSTLRCDEGIAASGLKMDDERREVSPQPIPYSPIEDLYRYYYYYYVPLDDRETASNVGCRTRPASLTDLCAKRILSMPFGPEIIDRLTASTRLNISEKLPNEAARERLNKHGVPEYADTGKTPDLTRESWTPDTRRNAVSDRSPWPGSLGTATPIANAAPLDVTDFERDPIMNDYDRRRTWLGVSTSEDSRLLLCLSPSQRKTPVRASADNLLDLHRKFLNRHSYRDAEPPRRVTPASYRLRIRREEEEKERHDEDSLLHRRPALLEIIERDTARSAQAEGNDESRLKVTRLCDWLNLARRDPSDSAGRRLDHRGHDDIELAAEGGKGADCDKARLTTTSALSSTARRRLDTKGEPMMGDAAAAAPPPPPPPPAPARTTSAGQYRVNSALIANSSPEKRSRSPVFNATAPVKRSPLTLNSAIIDKSGSSPEAMGRRTSPMAVTLQRQHGEHRYQVNPALIDDKLEVPPRVKRHVTVDRSCIDTTSIFDQAPPRCHLESKKLDTAESLKRYTATEIVEKLKRLQDEAATGREARGGDDKRRSSLPRDHFDRQLKYIEALEDQLKNVILAEEEERKAFEEYSRAHTGQRDDKREKRRGTEAESSSGKVGATEEESGERQACSNGPVDRREESWRERTETCDRRSSESVDKAGHRNFSKEVRGGNGVSEEETRERIESTERRVITRKSKLEGGRDRDEDENSPLSGSRRQKDSKEEKPSSEFAKSKKDRADDEAFRRRMYDEYVHEVLEREERKHRKVVKIGRREDARKSQSETLSSSSSSSCMNAIEREFIEKARNRLNKFGIKLDESEPESDQAAENRKGESSGANDVAARCLIDGREVEDSKRLPQHLREFLRMSTGSNDEREKVDENVMFVPTFKASSTKPGVWSPGSEPSKEPSPDRAKEPPKDAGIPPVWTPSSAGASPVPERKEFRPVQFESPTLSRRKKPQDGTEEVSSPPWRNEEETDDEERKRKKETTSPGSFEGSSASRIVNSHSAPLQGLNTLASSTPRLPRAQNPTITLLQKAREGQLPKGAAYIEETESGKRPRGDDKPSLVGPGEIIYKVKKEYESEPETENEPPKKMVDLGPRKFEGIGPTSREGIPLVLRSEVKENNQTRWYKKMYDSLHRADRDDDYVTIRYKPRRGVRYAYGGGSSGYLSEPEPRAYADRSVTLDSRRRLRGKENDFSTSTMPRKNGPLKYSPDVYKNQPGRIEDYEPGRSSIAEKETKEWWDEVMDIFDGWLDENSGHRDGDLADRSHGRRLHRALSLSYRPDIGHNVRELAGVRAAAPTAKTLETPVSRNRTNEHEDTAARQSHQQHASRQQQRPRCSLDRENGAAASVKDEIPDRGAAASVLTNDSNEDRIIRPLERSSDFCWHAGMLEGRSKSFVLPDRCTRRSSPLIGDRGSIARAATSAAVLASPGYRIDHLHYHHHHLHQFQQQQQQQQQQQKQQQQLCNSIGPVNATNSTASSNSSNNNNDNTDNSHNNNDHHHLHHHHLHHHQQQQAQQQHQLQQDQQHNQHHHHHHHDHLLHYHQRVPPSSSSTASSLSSTDHITLPPPSPTTPSLLVANALGARAPPASSRPFDQRSTQPAKPYITHALKESGYESDSTLVFRRREDISPLSLLEQRSAYKAVQSGGDVPLHGLRKPAPERPKDDSEIEYFPISPSLTRIRVRRKNVFTTGDKIVSSTSMIISRSGCQRKHSASTSSRPTMRLETTRYAPSRANSASRSATLSSSQPGKSTSSSIARPPSPPRRRSSRNNETLKQYSRTGYVESHQPRDSTTSRRHEQCFLVDKVPASDSAPKESRHSANLEKPRRNRDRRTIAASIASLSNVEISSPARSRVAKKKSEAAVARSQSESSTTRNAITFSESVRTRVSASSSPVARSGRISTLRSDQSRSRLEASLSTSRDLVTRPSSSEKSDQVGARVETAGSSRKESSRGRLTRKEQERSCNRLCRSSADVSSILESKKGSQKPRDRDKDKESKARNLSTATIAKGLIVPVVASGKRRNSVDKLGKTISSKGSEASRRSESSKSAGQTPSSTLGRKAASIQQLVKQKIAKQLEKVTTKAPLTSTLSSTGVPRETNKRKRPREKARAVTKSTTRKPEVMGNDSRKIEAKSKVRKDKDSAKSRNSNEVENKDKKLGQEPEKTKTSRSKLVESRASSTLKMADLGKHQESTRQDRFFQSLFLRNSSPTSSRNVERYASKKSLVSERMRMFQADGRESFKSEPSLKSLSVYLAHKRPVSNSRFKNWDRESVSSRSSSPGGVAWPGRSVLQKVGKFDSLLRVDEFGSTTSSRGRSPDLTRDGLKERSLSEPPLKTLPEKADERAPSSSRASSPSTVRSTAHHRTTKGDQEASSISFKKIRARSAGEADDLQGKRSYLGSNVSLARSSSSLCPSPVDREDYQRYILELVHYKRKSRRYKDLHDFYASLERMGELERTASSGDLRPRMKNEEIIDYERWKEVRSKERAECELSVLYDKLKAAQKDKDLLYSAKDVDKFKWHGDCGLRCKERSVENILRYFERLENEESELESSRRREIASRKDVYKPLWRGNSVINVATTMQRKARDKQAAERSSDRPSLQRSLGGSKKFWSSLSIEQVTALKNQLNEIYGSEIVKSRSSKRDEDTVESPTMEDKTDVREEGSEISSKYEIVVNGHQDGKGLHVRCHSMITTDESANGIHRGTVLDTGSFRRSGSIGRGKSVERSADSAIAPAPSMTELEKKRLSLTLGREILDKVTRRRSSSAPIAPRETRGAIAAALATPRTSNAVKAAITTEASSAPSIANTSPRTCYSLDAPYIEEPSKLPREKSDFLLVLAPNGDTPLEQRRVQNVMEEWSKRPPLLAITMPRDDRSAKRASATSGSEMDSTSSETSIRTVIKRSVESEDVPGKIEFFENIDRQSSDAKQRPGRLSSSQSFADLKELFGETESARLPYSSSSVSPRMTSATRDSKNNFTFRSSKEPASINRVTFPSSALRARSASPKVNYVCSGKLDKHRDQTRDSTKASGSDTNERLDASYDSKPPRARSTSPRPPPTITRIPPKCIVGPPIGGAAGRPKLTETAGSVSVSTARSVSPRDSIDRGDGGGGTQEAEDSTRRWSFQRYSERDHDSRPCSVSPCRATTRSNSSCSVESLLLRGTSPDPERYWRAYLKLVKSGTVRRLKTRFESADELPRASRSRVCSPTPVRCQSDPELARDLLRKVKGREEGKSEGRSARISRSVTPGVLSKNRRTEVAWLDRKGRGESPPIPRMPLRLDNLSMPHIDVISKTAELKKDTASGGLAATVGKVDKVGNYVARRVETRLLEAKRPVGRIVRKFEDDSERTKARSGTSILGEMFTSAPDVRELRDIAPYLAGKWVAHR